MNNKRLTKKVWEAKTKKARRRDRLSYQKTTQ